MLTPSLDSLGLLFLHCLQAGDTQGHSDLLTQQWVRLLLSAQDLSGSTQTS